MTLPDGWAAGRIGDLIARAEDIFCDGDWVESKDQDPNGDVRLIQLADVGDAKYLDRSARFLTKRKAAELRCTFITKGDVLIARMPDPLGRACIFPGDAKAAITVVDVCIVRTSNVNSRWLMWFVNAPAFRAQIAVLQSGSTRKRISRGNLATLSLPVPPLAEQSRIVSAIEEQLSRVDAGVLALERVKEELARFRASVLKAACEGRLVPTEATLARAENRSYEPASELVARILAERRARWDRKKRYAEPAPPDTSSLPTLPEGWVWTNLAVLAELKGGITKGQKRKAADQVRKVPYLRVANVQRGWLDLSEIKLIEATEAEIDELRLERGDVLFNEGGDRDKLGRGWIWESQLPECVHQNHVFRARLYEGVHPKLLSWHGNTFGKLWFEEHGKQTTNLASINLTKLGLLPVPLPPRSEQHRIVAEVERRLSIADEVAATIDSVLARAARLRQSILKRAFEGKLVPQDPNDEPASVLLARIRAEREAEAASRPKRLQRARRRNVTASDTAKPDSRPRKRNRRS